MGRVLVTHGARAAEARLLERIDELLAASAGDPTLLATPIRIVVPSGSLRDHLLSRLVAPRIGAGGARSRRAVAGIAVQTLFSLAREVVERAGEAFPLGERLFEVIARREARREKALSEPLDALVEGYSSVLGSVRDLLDAGLEPEDVHTEAAEEVLRSDGPALAGRAAVERAVALVRTAARSAERLEGLGHGRRSTLLRRANELLREPGAGEGRLAARSVLIHGFADATGVASDLLETLIRHFDAEAILDHPLRPFEGRAETAFAARFGDRLRLAAHAEETESGRMEPGSVQALEAVGTDAEVRAVAVRVRALLAARAAPEGIGLVARDLGPYRFALSRHLGRLGIPFTAPGTAGALDREDRRCSALLELLEKGETTPTDRWLDVQALGAADSDANGRPAHLELDLRLALHSLGAGRLRAVAGLSLDRLGRDGALPLPIRHGLEGSDPDPERDPDAEPEDAPGTGGRPARRSIPIRQVREQIQGAARLVRHLAEWPARAPLSVHARFLRTVLGEGLGWREGDTLSRRVGKALDDAAAELPADFALDREELRLLLQALLVEPGRTRLGGEGGGIQVLSVTEARGRTFDQLFVLGLQRNSFPRVVRQDPLFPDDLRRVLQRILPDIPIKLAGYDEERYLFAQLLSAAPAVTLSWQSADEDGKPLPASPLVDGLRGRIAIERAPSLWTTEGTNPSVAALTASELATLAGLARGGGGREPFARLLPYALAEGQEESPRGDPSPELRSLARARMAVLDELDPDLRTEEGRAVRAALGPYFGFLGPLGRRPLFVTQLENLAACPWQLFLERLLGLEPSPDPTGLLPGIDASLLGRTVHEVLEQIGRLALPDGGKGETAGAAVAAPWPEAEELERLAHQAAEELLAEDGIHLAGLTRALAHRSLPFLAVARRIDWGTGPLALVGVEVKGALRMPGADGRPFEVGFRADRVDEVASAIQEGQAVRRWTDYKTGRPPSSAKREATRAAHFLARVGAGTQLQAVAYLRSGGSGAEPPGAIGRYLYLRPDIEGDEARDFAVTPEDLPVLAAFDRATTALLETWEQGAFFPRLVDPAGREEPARCQRCQVAEACLRGDSGARRRLFDWTLSGGAKSAAGAEGALLATWRLAGGSGKPRDEEGGG